MSTSNQTVLLSDAAIAPVWGEDEYLVPELQPSLQGLRHSVAVPQAARGFLSQLKAFIGPAVLISVGYMDPGNWGTDLQGGAQFRYVLLSVVALASAMAVILQILSARLGVVTEKDLAQCCRDWYPRWTRIPNWLLSEVAIGACDLAEVLGSAVAINLLFHVPMLWAVLLTGFDVLLLLTLQGLRMRMIEALVVVLVTTIASCYGVEIFVLPAAHPDILTMGSDIFRPHLQADMVFAAIGIIGATVMPHNLYLHSALVQSRKVQRDEPSIRTALRFNTLDSVVSLSVAFLINAAILILAAHVFYNRGSVTLPSGESIALSADCDWIRVAFLTLAPLLGTAAASTLFACALLASGQSSTITGTLAGQVVMEGFMNWRIRPWVRRLLTRSLAILPAVVLIALRGERSITDLLILSQVVLALQLPFAMFPLLHFTGSSKRMRQWKSGRFLMIAGWASAILITALDIYGLPGLIRQTWQIVFGA
ncbi:Nramp family divalent metal transporter [Telmatobacter bradus]|uniref:Nramp family divalent metal transporter n=1 Tax=Telmatobacter bradus TaxID=474953 RepID=UPI003B42A62B